MPGAFLGEEENFDEGCHGEVMLDWKGHNDTVLQVMNYSFNHGPLLLYPGVFRVNPDPPTFLCHKKAHFLVSCRVVHVRLVSQDSGTPP